MAIHDRPRALFAAEDGRHPELNGHCLLGPADPGRVALHIHGKSKLRCCLGDEIPEGEILPIGDGRRRMIKGRRNIFPSHSGWTKGVRQADITPAGEDLLVGLRVPLDEFGHRSVVLRLDLRAASPSRAKALAGAFLLAQFQGDLATARARVDELLSISEALQDEAVLLLARGASAQLALVTGEVAVAERLDEETLELAYRSNDAWSACRELANKAYCALHRGDLASARVYLEKSVGLARKTGDTWSLAMALGELGDLERVQGAHEPAGALYAESLAPHDSLKLGERSPSLIRNLGYVALALHEASRAATHFIDALEQFR